MARTTVNQVSAAFDDADDLVQDTSPPAPPPATRTAPSVEKQSSVSSSAVDAVAPAPLTDEDAITAGVIEAMGALEKAISSLIDYYQQKQRALQARSANLEAFFEATAGAVKKLKGDNK